MGGKKAVKTGKKTVREKETPTGIPLNGGKDRMKKGGSVLTGGTSPQKDVGTTKQRRDFQGRAGGKLNKPALGRKNP